MEKASQTLSYAPDRTRPTESPYRADGCTDCAKAASIIVESRLLCGVCFLIRVVQQHSAKLTKRS